MNDKRGNFNFRKEWDAASKWRFDWKEDDTNNENAIRCYTNAIAADASTTEADKPNEHFAMAYCNRGICYREIGEKAKAKADFKTAYQLHPCAHYKKMLKSV